MKKYKVEFVRTDNFEVDVLAESEEKAVELAEVKFAIAVKNGTEHYLQTDYSNTELGTIYDVSNTDDPFNP